MWQATDFLDFSHDPVSDIHHVGSGGFADRNANSVIAVQVSAIGSVWAAECDFRNVAQSKTVLIDDDIANIFDGRKLAAWPDAESLSTVVDAPCADSEIASNE